MRLGTRFAATIACLVVAMDCFTGENALGLPQWLWVICGIAWIGTAISVAFAPSRAA